jgi:hypothetical protein
MLAVELHPLVVTVTVYVPAEVTLKLAMELTTEVPFDQE